MPTTDPTWGGKQRAAALEEWAEFGDDLRPDETPLHLAIVELAKRAWLKPDREKIRAKLDAVLAKYRLPTKGTTE